ncbi:hypothetical protein FM101_10625 [Arthrobacter rhombi]|uniref:Uncharacterized protein n=1 Tax=Arthrobacter rhombi TaxID=71253 RepID=A0A1R4GI89_9MICC|nr:hypothetical protein FM101_10625 [Arthrobacter rhombi]
MAPGKTTTARGPMHIIGPRAVCGAGGPATAAEADRAAVA